MDFNKISKQEIQKRGDFIKRVLSQVDDEALIIIRGHLIIEFYMNIILSFLNEGKQLDDNKITFFRKVQILKKKLPKIDVWEGILKFNELRNKVAHSLDAKLREVYFRELKVMWINIAQIKDKEEIEALNDNKNILSSNLFYILGYLDSYILNFIMDNTKDFEGKSN